MRSHPTSLPSWLLVTGLLGLSLASLADLGNGGVYVPYTGHLERDNVPLSETVNLQFEVFTAASGGTACQTTAPLSTDVNAGAFSVVVGPLDENCILDRSVYLEVLVDDGSGATRLSGRSQVHPALAASTSGNGDFYSNDVRIEASANVFGSNSAGNLHIDTDDSKSNGRLYLNYYSGNGVRIGNGSGTGAGVVVDIDTSGNIAASGDLSGASLDVTGAIEGGSLTVDGAVTSTNGRVNTATIGDNGYGSAYAGFSHPNRASQGNYAFMQHSSGDTYVNAPSGEPVNVRINNQNKLVVTNTLVDISTDVDVAGDLTVDAIDFDGQKVCIPYTFSGAAFIRTPFTVSAGWSATTCSNFAQSLGAPQYQLGCIFSSNYSIGSLAPSGNTNNAYDPPSNCGW